MKIKSNSAAAIVGIGAIMPDALDMTQFWTNIKQGKYSITEVPENRWSLNKYYDPDPKAPDKSYSKIGGWVKEDRWDPLKWGLPIPPRVTAQMDFTQRWAVAAAREALMDFGYPKKEFDKDRTAVILGVAMGGDQHLYSSSRIFFPEYAELLEKSQGFAALPADVRKTILGEMRSRLGDIFPAITEDTMPGELSNIVAGRIAALYNFHGPNYIADAACASAVAGITAAVKGLEEYDYDLVVTGGIDANMSPTTFVKFCKIGALSATGTRPYAEGADGFIMGEGAAIFILKRLEDAERDGDKIYAVIRGIGGSSDGKGKGITAPNPIGQVFAVKRAWENSGVSPATASMIEGHGTSTSVGDAVELKCLHDVFGQFNLPVGSIALGSVKSNIGHLKGAAGSAGIAKAAMALHEKVLPPSLNFHKPNPGVDFSKSPFAVNTELRPWETKNGTPRRCGVSAFGFGGTNFHIVMEEHIPGRILSEQKTQVSMATQQPAVSSSAPADVSAPAKIPLRGAFVKGADSVDALTNQLEELLFKAQSGWMPDKTVPKKADLIAAHRIAIDFENAEDLAVKIKRAINGLKSGNPKMWDPLNAKGIFYGSGQAPKTAFLFTGQGSQYINMLKELREKEPIVAKTFDEADEIMTPLLGKPLTQYIFFNENDKGAIENAGKNLMQTEITQPAVLTVDIALFRLMQAYGVHPDFVMGHSLGEYGALVASGAMPFGNALRAVSARGSEMAKVQVQDKGVMAAIFATPAQIQEVIDKIDGYVEIANVNSYGQSVIGGETEPTLAAMKACSDAGYHVSQLPVSHAFHTRIVAPASSPFAKALENSHLQPPTIPIISNVTGDFYPKGSNVMPEIIELLSRQIASPVQFVKGINRLYDSGVRVFIEMGPKKALSGFVRDIMAEKEGVLNLFTNHPKVGDLASFNQGLCGMYASGLGTGLEEKTVQQPFTPVIDAPQPAPVQPTITKASTAPAFSAISKVMPATPASTDDRYSRLGQLFVEFMDKANAVYARVKEARPEQDIWITGASIGLPGVDGVFQDSNVEKLLNGEQFIGSIPPEFQKSMLDKNITRLVKMGKGGPRFETISRVDEVIKLAARKVNLDIVRDFGYPSARKAAIDSTTELAIGAGIDALRDAGIPLVLQYKTTTTGSKLPDRWLLPKKLQDDTGVIFTSAFPGYNGYAQEMREYYEHKVLQEQLTILNSLRNKLSAQNGTGGLRQELDERITEVQSIIDTNPYSFNRRFLLRVLSMGHSQFAEYIGARGPNVQINAACASTTLAVGLANDWIDAGRCRRVIIVSGDDITDDETIGWFSSGFLAVGAAATDEKVEDAALPFDKRRHGMIVGMGGASIVVESSEAARERGIGPICEVLGTVTANSAFHATQLDVEHIKLVMEDLVSQVEKRWGIDRFEMAAQTVFVSHETYTPARGGSASAEIFALRYVFKSAADKIVIANTKGMTGHAMAVGIEDVLAIKSLETGIVPPVPNFKEVDPELGMLNLSKGGHYPVRYALRLGAGFGSQISMSLLRWTPATADGARPKPTALGYAYRIADAQQWQNWLASIIEKEKPELEVFKRTLRIKDPMGEILSDVEESVRVQTAVEATDVEIVDVVETPKPQPAIAEPEPVDNVKTRILELIAEKTGYPIDMLNPELDLEADLGIDTVKQAELFAEIRGEYGIERDENLQLSNFPTLNHIIQFVFDKRPELRQPVVATTVAQAAPKEVFVAKTQDSPSIAVAVINAGNAVKERILALISEKTGYPIDMLDPDLDLEADLGIDTVKQAELFAEIRGEYGIERDENLQLSAFPTLNHIIQFVFDKRPELRQTAPSSVGMATPGLVSSTKIGVATLVAPSIAIAVGDTVKERILALISDKTGYPIEMLDPELDLEADLGIDTVKQAELFSEIRGEYGIERDENLQLSEFPTLNHIIQFVYDRKPELKKVAAIPVSVPVSEASATRAVPVTAEIESPSAGNQVKKRIVALISEKTGYPVEMLDPELDLEADLGIDTVKQAELFAEIRGEYGIERDENLQLSEFPTLNHIIQFVYDKRPDLRLSAASAAQVKNVSEEPEKTTADPVQVAPAPVTMQVAGAEEVKAKVLSLVASKTGYPIEMLDPDLDLEADLGIDTVKQAELFAEIRGEYGIERDENLQLSEFPTLNHIIGFVLERRTRPLTSPDIQIAGTGEVHLPVENGPTIGDLNAVNQIPRRIPAPNLRPDIKFCKSTGILLDASSRIVVMPDNGGVGKSLISLLKKTGATVLMLKQEMSADELREQLKNWTAAGSIQGVYWLPALDQEGDITALSYQAWKAATQVRIKLLYATMRELILLKNENPFLVTATAMGGHFGYDENGALAPLGGAVSGFTKAYKREHPGVQVKVVDFDKSRKTTVVAQALVEETLLDNGVVEVGYKNGQRWTIGLEEVPQLQGEAGMKLNKDTTFLVTGAAGSITSVITADLAAASGGTFFLMDLTPVPDKANKDLMRFATDREGLKRDLFNRMTEVGDKPTPVKVEKELAGIERKYSALAAIEAVENAGGTAHYYSVNLTDPAAVSAAIEDIKKKAEKIDVLLHAGGLEISRLLPDKSPQEFDLVFDVKADGWYNLLSALGEFPVAATVAFSSIAGRFGNAGQTDYSAANDFLCKSATSFRTSRRQTRGIALDWTAWKDIGMAARGSIPTVMKQAGIDMLPPEAGIPFIRKELTSGTRGLEVVVAQSLGRMVEEFDQAGGLDLKKEAPVHTQVRQAKGVMAQEVVGMGLYDGLVVKGLLDPHKQGFLFDHQINDTPVLPGVMGVEAMLEAASLLFPDLNVVAVEEVDFFAPFKFYRSEPREVSVKVNYKAEGEEILAFCELLGSRKLMGYSEEEVKTHFKAKVRLSKSLLEAPAPITQKLSATSKDTTAQAEDIYKLYFHGPAYQVLEKAWKKGDDLVGLYAGTLPPNHEPAELQTKAAPRFVELCFQTAGIGEMGVEGRMGLPMHIDKLQIFRQPAENGKLKYFALLSQHGKAWNALVLDGKGEVYLKLEGYKTVEFISEFDKSLLKPLQAVVK